MQTFFLAMLAYPEVQRKAQEEIDRVVGNGRLPTLEDRKNLPYVDAVVNEAFRWRKSMLMLQAAFPAPRLFRT